MSARHDPAIPRGAPTGALGLVAIVLAVTAAVPLGLLDPPKSAARARAEAGVTPVTSRDLRFLDRVDGAVIVEDVRRPDASTIIHPGSNQGFIRGVMRGLARDRKMRGFDARPPFQLTLWRNGRLSLQDSATGRVIELDSFGADNRAAFAALLRTKGTKS